MVLGFGVVWWSFATIMTPIAARLGLPFLLVVRAFMGIGEVGLFCISFLFLCFSQTCTTSHWLVLSTFAPGCCYACYEQHAF